MGGRQLIGGVVLAAGTLAGLGVLRQTLYERTHGTGGAGRSAAGRRPHLTVGFLPVT